MRTREEKAVRTANDLRKQMTEPPRSQEPPRRADSELSMDAGPIEIGASIRNPDLHEEDTIKKISTMRQDWDKNTESILTRYRTTKFKTVWRFKIKDIRHTITLRHNTYLQGGKSKRVVLVDGAEHYNDKSDQDIFEFILEDTKIRLVIEAKEKGYAYKLTLDGEPFEKLRNDFFNMV